MTTDKNIKPDFSGCSNGNIHLKLAETNEELLQSKKLRYFTFFDEPNGLTEPSGKIDEDEFDEICEHLLVMDGNSVVGTYRLLRRNETKKPARLYTESEFDISKLLASKHNLLELGRSCIHPDFRDGKVIQLLWKGLGIYLATYNIDYMFGCASFKGTDIEKYNNSIYYLMQNHLAPKEICPTAIASMKVDIKPVNLENVDRKEVLSQLPALLKGYIRAGCMVGDGAVKDDFCKTIDVCMIMDTSKIAAKYSNKFVG